MSKATDQVRTHRLRVIRLVTLVNTVAGEEAEIRLGCLLILIVLELFRTAPEAPARAARAPESSAGRFSRS